MIVDGNVLNKCLHMQNNSFIAIAVYMPGCVHCEALKPVWKKLANKKMKNIKMAWIHMNDVKNISFLQNERIDGYPYIVGYKSGKKVDYNAFTRDNKTLQLWMQQNRGLKRRKTMKGNGKSLRSNTKKKSLRSTRKKREISFDDLIIPM